MTIMKSALFLFVIISASLHVSSQCWCDDCWKMAENEEYKNTTFVLLHKIEDLGWKLRNKVSEFCNKSDYTWPITDYTSTSNTLDLFGRRERLLQQLQHWIDLIDARMMKRNCDTASYINRAIYYHYDVMCG